MVDVLKRVRNMVYNTSEKYDVKVDMKGGSSKTDTETVTIATLDSFMRMGLTEEEATSVVMHAAGHEGAHVKHSTKGAIGRVMTQARADKANLKLLNGMIQCAEDYRVDYETSKERPGYWTQRSESMVAANKLFGDKPSGDKVFDFTKAVSFLTHDSDLRKLGWKEKDIDWKRAEAMAKKLEELATSSKSSDELLDKVYGYYKTEFGTPPESPEDESEDENEGTEESTEESNGGSGTSSDMEDSEEDTEEEEEDANESEDTEDSSTSSEVNDTKSKKSGTSGVKLKKPDGAPSKSDSAEDDLLSDDTEMSESEFDELLKEMEKAMDGKTSSEKDMIGEDASKELETLKRAVESEETLKSKYQKDADNYIERLADYNGYTPLWSEEERKRIQSSLSVGIHAGADILYVKKKNIYRRIGKSEVESATALGRSMGSKLLQVLKAEVNDMGYVSNSGAKIMANKVWKPLYTSDSNVFYKKDFTENGGYVIDLVLDASGSQGGRNKSIAKQALIVAEACSIANIPCRVTQFRNESSVTILERLRDFDDAREKNMDCTGFNAEGDNRDGLALQIANIELQKRKEQNKIMLVLSDGAPCDTGGGAKMRTFGGKTHYVSDATGMDDVTKDVHKVVQDIRKSGTALMGIYVGESPATLKLEKLMYGSDFAYIGERMESFVDVVMKYLVRHIQKMDV